MIIGRPLHSRHYRMVVVLGFFSGLTACTWFCSLDAIAQSRTVAVTVDDLPYAGAGNGRAVSPLDVAIAEEINRKLLSAFRHHHVPVTGFVIQRRVEELGVPAGTEILREWTNGQFDLGNHTYSHPDINQLSIAEIEDEIIRGESSFVPLMKQAGKKTEFFRFPMNHTGDTKEKHDQLAAFLSGQGYRLAACTIDNSDYIFNGAYVRMLGNHDPSAQKLRSQYLSYTSTEIDYYAGLGRQIFGYEPPEVLLLHDNRLNADTIEQLLRLIERKQYKFVPLADAQSDPAYQVPDTYTSKYGPMWGYRWAAERGVEVNGKLETEPPEWILQYNKQQAHP
jgi:peptidoglycan/xylan/chitin deacetylase (PgdA/CDA1 family)